MRQLFTKLQYYTFVWGNKIGNLLLLLIEDYMEDQKGSRTGYCGISRANNCVIRDSVSNQSRREQWSKYDDQRLEEDAEKTIHRRQRTSWTDIGRLSEVMMGGINYDL